MIAENSKDLLNLKNLVFISVFLLSFLVLRSIFFILVFSAIIAYGSYPFYIWLNGKLKYKSVSAIITISSIIGCIFLAILFFIISFPFSEIDVAIDRVREVVAFSTNFFDQEGSLNTYLQGGINRVLDSSFDYISSLFLSVPQFAFSLFLVFFFTFYFLKYGKSLFIYFVEVIKLEKRQKENLINKVKDATDASIYGFLFIPLVQGTLALLALVVIGVPGAVALGLLTIFLALIPALGAYLVWVPISVYYILTGIVDGATFNIVKGALFGLYGFFVISHIDNVLRSRIISRKTNVNPGIILAGIVGGLFSFGFVGILIGPIILAVAVAVFQSLVNKEFTPPPPPKFSKK